MDGRRTSSGLTPCQPFVVLSRHSRRLLASGHFVYANRQMAPRHETNQPDMQRRVAANLTAAMAEAGISAAEMARRIENHERAVRRWMAGDVRPGDDKLARMADVLGRDMTWFYVAQPEPAKAAAA